MTYQQILDVINLNIKQNGNEEITGDVMNAVLKLLLDFINKQTKDYKGYNGFITENSRPNNVRSGYWLANSGIYSNFGVEVSENHLGVVYWNEDRYVADEIELINEEVINEYLNNKVVHLYGDEVIDGNKEFTSPILNPIVPTDNNHLANKKYVDETIDTNAIQRIDTEENWMNDESILYAGEIALVEKNGKLFNVKFGDGTKKFSELPYMYKGGFDGFVTKSTDPNTLIDGFYFAKEYGIYTNLGNLLVKDNSVTIIQKSGNNFYIASEIDIPYIDRYDNPVQFTIKDASFEPNYQANKNKIKWNDFNLIHFGIDENIKEWQVQAGTFTVPNDLSYIVYIKCSRTDNQATIDISTENKQPIQDDYYYFTLGVLNSPEAGSNSRTLSLLQGITTISGKYIKTGRISSNDGSTYFDLDSGEFKGKFTFTNGESVEDAITNQEIYIEYSENGIDWHSTFQYDDVFMRQKKGDGAWSNAIRIAGIQGIKGDKGEDGQTQYVHIRYSANSDGSSMTTTPQANTAYIGIVTTTSSVAPISNTSYTWAKFKGEQGTQGVPGIQGSDGSSLYTWVKYADTPTSGMSDYPDDKLYIGLAYNKVTATESDDYSDYSWSLMPQNIEIGGRNLILNSKSLEGRTDSYGGLTTAVMPLSIKLEKDKEYIFIYKNNNDIPRAEINTITLRNANGETIQEIQTIGDGSETIFKVNVDGVIGIAFYSVWKNAFFSFRELMLTSGNKIVDWTPAPEDVEASILKSKTDSITASKAYSDAQDELKRIQAEAYADGKVTAAEQRAIDDATAKSEAAKLYATAQDNLLRVQLEAYADGQITAEEQQRIQQMKDNLAAAKAYADAQDALAVIAAKAYADGIVTEEEQRAIQDAANKMESAKTYAQAQDNLLRTQLEAYADGIVTEEEKARILEAQNNLVLAKAYTDAQDELSKTLIKAYADGIVDEEEARAIADATAKMEAAKLHAQGLVNNIQIGGRNLLLNSKELSGRTDQWGGTSLSIIPLSTPLIKGKSYVFSYKNNNDIPRAEINIITLRDSSGVTIQEIQTSGDGSATIFNVNVDGVVGVYFYSLWKNAFFDFKYLLITEGNKVVSWTPAPEDVEASILEAKQLAEQANLKVANISNDNVLSASEKQQISNEWNRIKSEYTSNYSLGISNGVDTTNLTSAYNDLFNYINPLLVNLSVESPIVGDVFRAKFKAYYDQNIALLVAINEKIKQGINNNANNINNLNSSIARINQITSFLNTTVNGNVIGTGVLMVGSETQSNAGISGLNEAGSKSVRLWAGGTAQNRDKAAWNTLDDGTMQFFHPNGQIAFRFGVSNGKFIMDGYHEQGMKLWELSPNRGLVNVAYIPESWTNTPMININQSSSTLDVANAQSFLNSLVLEDFRYPGQIGEDGFYRWYFNNNYTSFEYQNGTHPDNSQYENLIGYKTMNDSRTANIPNGWYGLQIGTIANAFGEYPPPRPTVNYILYYIENGKVMKTQNINF